MVVDKLLYVPMYCLVSAIDSDLVIVREETSAHTPLPHSQNLWQRALGHAWTVVCCHCDITLKSTAQTKTNKKKTAALPNKAGVLKHFSAIFWPSTGQLAIATLPRMGHGSFEYVEVSVGRESNERVHVL